ncbi:transcriptional regulator, partial [Planctomycetota bacterium]
TSEALQAGITPKTFYTLRDRGVTVCLSRGLYKLADTPSLTNYDLFLIGKKINKGVICLISALAFYELTLQIPHEVYVALPKGTEEPRLDYPPVRTFRFSSISYKEGIESYILDGEKIHIYSREKTIADCFKFRNKTGLDTAIEALRLYKAQRNIDIKALMHYASVCRITKVIKPYLESIL